jgi:hypothetical protein
MATLLDPTDEKRPDRVAREQRIQESRHPHLVPDKMALHERELPWIVRIEALSY